MEDVKIVQLNVKIQKDKRFKFKYLCESQNTNMGAAINQFIDQYINERMPDQKIENVKYTN